MGSSCCDFKWQDPLWSLKTLTPFTSHWLHLPKGLPSTLGTSFPGIWTGRRVSEDRHPITATPHTQWAPTLPYHPWSMATLVISAKWGLDNSQGQRTWGHLDSHPFHLSLTHQQGLSTWSLHRLIPWLCSLPWMKNACYSPSMCSPLFPLFPSFFFMFVSEHGNSYIPDWLPTHDIAKDDL